MSSDRKEFVWSLVLLLAMWVGFVVFVDELREHRGEHRDQRIECPSIDQRGVA